ncbi:MAG TPA: CocE/NonD family hydrolase, partial [Thermoanaerobaculia bacterium]|nr:CocE/NonD family hydrolase [Thermoanaerobaculia bacterium]
LPGDWVGWAYLDEGGDLPLRLRLTAGPEGLAARFDELVARRYDLPVQHLAWDGATLRLERTRPGGGSIRLEGTLRGHAIRGRLDWLGHAADFELLRSPHLLARIPPERWEGIPGTYRLGPGRSLVLTSRFWGELLVTDLATGRHGTLFPLDTDLFFLGAALYAPAPAAARLRFHRDEEGEVTAVEWQEGEGEPITGERIPFVEEEVSFESDGVRLAGTLLRPAGSAPLPAAAVLGGSDWTEREGTRRDASILASFGMATLIYDKRGFGESGGEAVVSFHQTARDAAAAAAWLAGRPDVLPGQVGLTGRSRSGWTAPLAASLAPQAAFLVLFVPPAVSPAAQETTRRLHLLADRGFSPDQRELAAEMLAAAWRFAATGEGWQEYAELRRRAASAGLPEEEVLEPAAADDPEWQWTRLNMAYDPLPVLEDLRTPLLALFGERDRNVVVAENLPRMRAALERGGHPDFELRVVPGADHGLRMVLEDGDVPPHRRVGFGPAGWPDVAAWLAARLDLWGSPADAP